MTRKDKHKNGSGKTSFVCHAAEATNVFLAGTFNNWDPQASPMHRNPQGGWQIALNLAPGQYEYKFVVDGKWCCEPGREDATGCPNCVRDERGIQCANCVPNGFGTMNRVLEVNAGRSAEASASRAA